MVTANPRQDKNASTKKDEVMSEEDIQLKSELDMLVQRLKETDHNLYLPSLETLRNLIRSSTTSLTSVPKPLKFLRARFQELVGIFQVIGVSAETKVTKFMSDILSVLAMTQPVNDFLVLKYRLTGGFEDVDSWGHEYVRHLALEIIQLYSNNISGFSSVLVVPNDVLITVAKEIVPFFLRHNAEPDACDLLVELESLEILPELVDSSNYSRICLYLTSCVNYEAYPDDIKILKVVHEIYNRMNMHVQAISMAIRLRDMNLILSDFLKCKDKHLRRQMAFILARQGISVDEEHLRSIKETSADEVSVLLEIFNNSRLSEYFNKLQKDLEISTPRIPEDIYKRHLEPTRKGESFSSTTTIDSAKQNLAATFANAFINAGSGKDKLLYEESEKKPDDSNTDTNSDPESKPTLKWIYKNKDWGFLSAAASLGALHLWNVEEGLASLDAYLYAEDELIKAGASLGIGIVNINVKNDTDPALALLSESLAIDHIATKIASIMGLGLAYAGSNKQSVSDLLLPLFADPSTPMEVIGIAALALGNVFVGSADGEISSTLLQLLLERSSEDYDELFKNDWTRYIGLGLSFLYLGQQEEADAALETLKVLPDALSKALGTLLQACAYAGTGNVLQIQKMLQLFSEKTDKEKAPNQDFDSNSLQNPTSGLKKEKDNTNTEASENPSYDLFKTFAVLGAALIAMGEDIGSNMSLRLFSHLMHYGDSTVKRSVPLALALLSPSNPNISILETLLKLSHDSDTGVASSAIFSLGIVGSGTNNARLAQMLRGLAAYHRKDPNMLFLVRISQGLLAAGKGTLTLNPLHSDRNILSPRSVTGLLSTLLAFTNCSYFINGQHHYLMYWILQSLYPRFLYTFDAESLESIVLPVRVGTAVDVVGLAGKPKTITGFQTQNTPILMNFSERSELATEDWEALTAVMEGFVLVKKKTEDSTMDLSSQ